MRLGTANTYTSTVDQLTQRQSSLSQLQEKLSAGKRVIRPSDDPAAVAHAERASIRISRVQAEQKALTASRNSMSLLESSLGNGQDLLQQARELMVSAGNDGLNASDQKSIAQQLAGIKDQLLALANRQDSNAFPIFGGQGSTSQPFLSTPTGVVYAGTRGQPGSDDFHTPGSMDGNRIFMGIPSGNGSFEVQRRATNQGSAWADPGQTTDLAALTGHPYQIQFTDTGSGPSYTVVDAALGQTVVNATPYADGQTIRFDGLAVTLHGQPANGDGYDIVPSSDTSIFNTLDAAIAGLLQNSKPARMETLQRSLAQLDTGLDNLSSARAVAGQMLNRIDANSSLLDSLSTQLESDRSSLEDMDMVKGISEFQSEQTAYEAALKSYAQINKLSLFQFLG